MLTEAKLVKHDIFSFVDQALQTDPRVAELEFGLQSKTDRIAAIKKEVILPRLQGGIAFGPAPGLQSTVNAQGDSISVWDFTKLGPYFGTEINFAQPLNVGQLLTGIDAAQADYEQTKWDIRYKKVHQSLEYQQMYYGYLLSVEMLKLAADAEKQLERAEEAIEDALDDDVEGVSQNDLLTLRAGSYQVAKGQAESQKGYAKANSAMYFALNLEIQDSLELADSLLLPRTEIVPPLDTLRLWLRAESPELKRLKAGLSAKSSLVELEKAKLGPEFFVFGSFKYAKSWAGDRKGKSRDVFSEDPINTLSGSLGLGLRYKLNVWHTAEKVRQSKTDLRQLQMLEKYAASGLELQLEDYYHEYLESQTRLEAVQKSLRATDAMLKGAAMSFDLDPSNPKALLNAYVANMNMQKDYYFEVYRYNMAVAKLMTHLGLLLQDYLPYLN